MGSGTKHALDFNDAAEEARNKFKLVGRRQRAAVTLTRSQCPMHFNARVRTATYYTTRIISEASLHVVHDYLFTIHVRAKKRNLEYSWNRFNTITKYERVLNFAQINIPIISNPTEIMFSLTGLQERRHRVHATKLLYLISVKNTFEKLLIQSGVRSAQSRRR